MWKVSRAVQLKGRITDVHSHSIFVLVTLWCCAVLLFRMSEALAVFMDRQIPLVVEVQSAPVCSDSVQDPAHHLCRADLDSGF